MLIINILFQIVFAKNTGTLFLPFFSNLDMSKSKLISKENSKNTILFWPEKFIRYIVS
jgi:hypothetical protein